MRRYLIAGLLVWLPIWATVVMIRFCINIADSTIAMLPLQYQPDQWIGHHIPGIGLLIVFLFLLATGLLVTNYLGRQLVQTWDKMIASIPLVRTIHSAVKHLTQAILGENGSSFSKVFLVEYPRRGIWSIAFQTNTEFKHAPQAENMTVVFIPTTPNPTSGFLIMVPQEDAHELDISVEEAIRMVISLGAINPKKPEENSTQDN